MGHPKTLSIFLKENDVYQRVFIRLGVILAACCRYGRNFKCHFIGPQLGLVMCGSTFDRK